jgi:hypothetical protein
MEQIQQKKTLNSLIAITNNIKFHQDQKWNTKRQGNMTKFELNRILSMDIKSSTVLSDPMATKMHAVKARKKFM